MWITYSVLSCKLVIFRILNIKFEKIFFITLFVIALQKSSLNWEVSLIHWSLFTASSCDFAQPCKLFTFQNLRYKDSLFLSYSFIYLLLAFAYWWIAWHTSPLIPFSTINSISISINNSDFTSVLFKAACHANPGAERNFVGSKW